MERSETPPGRHAGLVVESPLQLKSMCGCVLRNTPCWNRFVEGVEDREDIASHIFSRRPAPAPLLVVCVCWGGVGASRSFQFRWLWPAACCHPVGVRRRTHTTQELEGPGDTSFVSGTGGRVPDVVQRGVVLSLGVAPPFPLRSAVKEDTKGASEHKLTGGMDALERAGAELQ